MINKLLYITLLITAFATSSAYAELQQGQLLPEANEFTQLDTNKDNTKNSTCGDKADTISGLCALDKNEVKGYMDKLAAGIQRGAANSPIDIYRATDKRIDLTFDAGNLKDKEKAKKIKEAISFVAKLTNTDDYTVITVFANQRLQKVEIHGRKIEKSFSKLKPFTEPKKGTEIAIIIEAFEPIPKNSVFAQTETFTSKQPVPPVIAVREIPEHQKPRNIIEKSPFNLKELGTNRPQLQPIE